MSVTLSGPVAFLSESKSAVFFSQGKASDGMFRSNQGTAVPVTKMQNLLNVAYWGEDNRFPQNIEQQMAYCGIGKSALDWKARALWGAGIIPGKVLGYEDEGKKEIFEPLNRDKYKAVYSFIEARSFFRWAIEYLQDWVWYFNCFPEMILSKDGKTITGFVHQESNDCRFQQMDDQGKIKKVFLSKLWGAGRDQYVKFDPKRSLPGLMSDKKPTEVDNKFVKQLDCINMYDPVQSLKQIADRLASTRSAGILKSAILPVNYPSVNKTYYQVPYWDGARLGGWIEIACKIPSLVKTMYNKAFRIKYHIEVPESYFPRHYGEEKWDSMTDAEQVSARKKLLQEMDEFLSGDDNAFKTFVSFFDVDPHDHKEFARVKIEAIENKSNIDKELITQSAADVEILIAMQVHPSLFSAGMTGSMFRSGGGSGSDIREAYLVYNALLNLERNVFLEPLYLVRDYNRIVGGISEWEEDIVFRVRDTVLTTLDTGRGTTKTLS